DPLSVRIALRSFRNHLLSPLLPTHIARFTRFSRQMGDGTTRTTPAAQQYRPRAPPVSLPLR
ncbi:hypothetical protein RZS08_03670, partial [Arthrospira platensis SPKY1]|nr:hypothetical protein [Arthrospira platensis SPKY1]